jgi:hypothetical protein
MLAHCHFKLKRHTHVLQGWMACTARLPYETTQKQPQRMAPLALIPPAPDNASKTSPDPPPFLAGKSRLKNAKNGCITFRMQLNVSVKLMPG